MGPTAAIALGNVIILASFDMVNVSGALWVESSRWEMVSVCGRSAVIADTVYSAALKMPFISTRRSHSAASALTLPTYLALAANVRFKLEEPP